MENEKLIADIEHLKSLRIIDRNIDLVNSLGYSESTVSNYINGKVKASRNFLDKFYSYYKEHFYKETLHEVNIGLPVYDVYAIGGFGENIGQFPEHPVGYENISGYSDCDGIIKVYSASMSPTIESGARIIIKEVSIYSTIPLGEVFVLKTKDYLLVKRLQKAKIDENIVCVSDSPNKERYQDFDLPKSEIVKLWHVKGVINPLAT